LLASSATVGGVIAHAFWPAASTANLAPQTSGLVGQAPFGSAGLTPLPLAPGAPTGGSAITGSSADVAAIAAKVEGALVDINVTLEYQSARGAGTGIVLTSNGEILTNNHVINGATALSVTDVGNGKTYGAVVVGYDTVNDLAVLQLEGATGLQTAVRGNSSTAAVGQMVVAVGNAGGAGGTPSSAGGAITALNRSITASNDLNGTSEPLSGLIQFDATIQPGDSGGSLLNQSGQVIGVDTAASTASRHRSSGMQGFAIPMNVALDVAQRIEAGQNGGSIHVGPTAFLGVLITSTGSPGSSADGSPSAGAALGGVVPGQAAQKVGLTRGDVITSLGGHVVDSPATLSQVVAQYRPGNTLPIGWTDASGLAHSGTITMGSGPPA